MPLRNDVTVSFFWSGPPLPPLCVACLRSFLEKGYKAVLYSYDQPQVPDGVEVHDAREIMPEGEIFQYLNPMTGQKDIAPFVDYFRLKLLLDLGGWYCDVDTICLTDRLPVAQRIWASQGEESLNQIANGQIYFKAGDPILANLLASCRDMIPHMTRRESLGPVLMTDVIRNLGLPNDMNATCEEFYPIRWLETFKLWLPEFRDEVLARTANSIFLPLYQSFPLYAGFSPMTQPPSGSFLASFLDRFDVRQHGTPDTGDQVRNAIGIWVRKNTWVQDDLKIISKNLAQEDTWKTLI